MNKHLFGVLLAGWDYAAFVLILLVFSVGLVCYRYSWQKRIIDQLVGGSLGVHLQNVSLRRKLFKAIVFSFGLLFLSIAIFRPQWGEREEVITQEGRDLFIALDISRSMLATDCEPNRLVCAKQKIRQLLANLSCERVGLILFSGSAFVQCPLTADFGAFKSLLDQVDVETISSGTTALDQALSVALATFEGMPERKNKLLAIFTDGEDFSSNLKSLKSRSTEQGLRVFTVGVGTSEGAPIPLYDSYGKQIGHQMDRDGSVVISRVNDAILENLALEAGGQYVRMTQDASDVNMVAQRVQSFEKERFDDVMNSSLKDHYHIFLLGSFLCFVVEWFL